jgi:hypothetical protein
MPSGMTGARFGSTGSPTRHRPEPGSGRANSQAVMRPPSSEPSLPPLGAVGADFKVLAPPELRDHLRRIGELFTRATG